MADVLESETSYSQEIQTLKNIVEEMRRAGIRLRNELSDFVEVAKSDNASQRVFPEAQEAIAEWNTVVEQSGLSWKEDILKASGSASLKFLE